MSVKSWTETCPNNLSPFFSSKDIYYVFSQIIIIIRKERKKEEFYLFFLIYPLFYYYDFFLITDCFRLINKGDIRNSILLLIDVRAKLQNTTYDKLEGGFGLGMGD